MRKVYYKSWLAKLLLFGGFSTAMLFGEIHTKRTTALSEKTKRHESIHCEQYEEVTLIAFFLAVIISALLGWSVWPFLIVPVFYYILYGIEAAISWVHHFFSTKKKDAAAAADEAYYNSMFEMEAYEGESDPEWIQARKFCHWLKFFGKV